MLSSNVSDSTIALPGVEISGTQNSISSLEFILKQKPSDLTKPTHAFIIFNSGGCSHFILEWKTSQRQVDITERGFIGLMPLLCLQAAEPICCSCSCCVVTYKGQLWFCLRNGFLKS